MKVRYGCWKNKNRKGEPPPRGAVGRTKKDGWAMAPTPAARLLASGSVGPRKSRRPARARIFLPPPPNFVWRRRIQASEAPADDGCSYELCLRRPLFAASILTLPKSYDTECLFTLGRRGRGSSRYSGRTSRSKYSTPAPGSEIGSLLYTEVRRRMLGRRGGGMALESASALLIVDVEAGTRMLFLLSVFLIVAPSAAEVYPSS